jgi:hypothetical protein
MMIAEAICIVGARLIGSAALSDYHYRSAVKES